MTNFPSVPEIVEQLVKHKLKQAYSNAQLATNMNLFAVAWGWTEGHVLALTVGRVQPTEAEIGFIKLYLAQRFYDYNCT